jgi:hypothetical protein
MLEHSFYPIILLTEFDQIGVAPFTVRATDTQHVHGIKDIGLAFGIGPQNHIPALAEIDRNVTEVPEIREAESADAQSQAPRA